MLFRSVLTQSQSMDRNYASYQSAVTKLRSDLIANDKRRLEAERDIGEAQNDRERCQRDPAILAAGACANVTHRLDTAERRLAYARANQTKLEAQVADHQQRLATARASLAAAGASLTTAQQDLDEANKAYAAFGCSSDDTRSR